MKKPKRTQFPAMLRMKLRALDWKNELIEEFPCGTCEIEDLVFLRIPDDEVMRMRSSGAWERLSESVGETKKTFVLVPPGTEVMEVVRKWEVVDPKDMVGGKAWELGDKTDKGNNGGTESVN